MRSRLAYCGAIVAACLFLAAGCQSAARLRPSSQGEEGGGAPFYRGKTITVVVAYEAGSSQDREARAVAERWNKHIPGEPAIRVLNMPGAGGLQAVKYVNSGVTPDGLTVGFFGASPPTEQLRATYQPPEGGGFDVDVRQMKWLGGMGGESYLFVVNAATPYKNIRELLSAPRPVRAGVTRPGSTTFTAPAILKEVLNAPIEIVAGYNGSSDRDLAFFRGEIDAIYSSWDSFVSVHKDWLAERSITPLVAFGQRVPQEEYAKHLGPIEIPHILDLVSREDDVALVRLATYPGQWGRLMAAPPRTPDDRVAVLRDGFAALANDPEFQAITTQRGFNITPIPGAQIEQMIGEYLGASPDTIRRYIKMVQG